MNRRWFLKLLGAAPSALLLPATTATQALPALREMQWVEGPVLRAVDKQLGISIRLIRAFDPRPLPITRFDVWMAQPLRDYGTDFAQIGDTLHITRPVRWIDADSSVS